MTNTVTTDDIKKLAKLARIELSAEEETKLASEIGGILGYIGQIQTAAAQETARVKEPVRNAMRADDMPHESGAHTDVLVAEFPRKDGNSLVVKKIL